MITLRLFHEDDLQRQLDAYILGDGDVTIGRDAAAIWVIDDPDRRLSRLHCTVSVAAGQVRVFDTSANGVFLGPDRRRIDPGVDTDVPVDATFQIGRYVIVVDGPKQSDDTAAESGATHLESAPMADTAAQTGTHAIPEDWPDSQPALALETERPMGGSDFAILEAFCKGARLDPSYFASEDPVELMRRLGEIYQQLVLGLGDLMSQRATLKSEHSLERTTISATANNPLKWAPSQRLAVDLICERNGAFLSGGDAVRECFEDLKGHASCLVAGSRAAVSSVIEHLDPAAIETDVKANSPLFMERSEASWRKLKARHADVAADPFNNPESHVNEAFRRGYERRARDLDSQESKG